MHNPIYILGTGLFVVAVLYLLSSFLKINYKDDSKTVIILLISVSTFSIIYSGFTTINLIVFFLLFIWMFFAKKELIISKPKRVINWEIFVFYILVFFYFSYHFFDFQTFTYLFPWRDTNYYSELAKGLSFFPVENKQVVFGIDKLQTFDYYHFFDLWLNVLFNKIFGFNHYVTLTFLVYPLLASIYLHIAYQHFRFVFKKKRITLALVLLLPFTIRTPFFNYYYELLQHDLFKQFLLKHCFLSIYDFKVLINYIFCLLTAISFINKKIVDAVFFLLCMIILYSTTFIAVFPALIIFTIKIILTNNMKLKSEEKKQIILMILISVALIVSFILPKASSELNIQGQEIFPKNMKLFLVLSVECFIKLLVVYFPSFIIPAVALFKIKKNNSLYIYFKELLYLIILIAGIGIYYTSVNHSLNMDVPQSIDNVLIPFFTAINIISFKFLFENLKTIKRYILIVIILSLGGLHFNIVNKHPTERNQYSNTYIKKVLSSFEKVKTPQHYLTIYPFNKESTVIDTTKHIQKYRTKNLMADFTVLNNSIFLLGEIDFLKSSESSKKQFKEFVEKNKINYVFEAKDQTISSCYTLICRDSISGEKFYSTRTKN